MTIVLVNLDADVVATVIDLVVAITLVECVALMVHHRLTGRGIAPRDYFANLVSGLCLMLALRSLAHDAGAAWVAVFLLGAGVAHGTDLWLRWRRRATTARLARRIAT